MSEIRTPDSPKQSSNLDERRLEAGVLGKIFGTGDNAAKNIAGLIIFLLVNGALIGYFVSLDEGALFQIVVPIVTLGLGYLFGRQTGDV